jgi:hypothetical protein
MIDVGQSIGNFYIQYLENTRVRDIERKNIWNKKHYKTHKLIDGNIIPIKLTWLLIFKKWI